MKKFRITAFVIQLVALLATFFFVYESYSINREAREVIEEAKRNNMSIRSNNELIQENQNLLRDMIGIRIAQLNERKNRVPVVDSGSGYSRVRGISKDVCCHLVTIKDEEGVLDDLENKLNQAGEDGAVNVRLWRGFRPGTVEIIRTAREGNGVLIVMFEEKKNPVLTGQDKGCWTKLLDRYPFVPEPGWRADN